MSQENVEFVRARPGSCAHFHPEIEWITTGAFVEPGTCKRPATAVPPVLHLHGLGSLK